MWQHKAQSAGNVTTQCIHHDTRNTAALWTAATPTVWLLPWPVQVRIILNKSDQVDQQQLMRVYGALMWSLGKVFKSPEVCKVRREYSAAAKRLLRQHRHQLLVLASPCMHVQGLTCCLQPAKSPAGVCKRAMFTDWHMWQHQWWWFTTV